MTDMVQTTARAEVEILYNGRSARLHWTPTERVGTLLHRALRAFAIVANHEEMALFTTSGAELERHQELAQVGVKAGDELVLRQRAVQGGGRCL